MKTSIVAGLSAAALALWVSGLVAQDAAKTGAAARDASGSHGTLPGTKAMAALLAARATAVAPGDLWFNLNRERADGLAAALPRARTSAERLELRSRLAAELLYAGRYAESTALVDELLPDVRALGPAEGLFAEIELLQLQATTFMRWGEEQNCAEGHNQDSCLLPLKGGGIHQRQEGSRRALAVLMRLLKVDPGNLRARWLVNIAHMTLGSYPDGVPAELLVPPAAFTSKVPFPAFRNVASNVGLDIYGISGGAVLDDLDRDGFLDLMVTAVGFADQMRIFRGTAEGRFVDVTPASGLTGLTGGLNMVTGDYDNDGRLDVLVLRGAWMGDAGRFPVSLLRNLGGLRFEDVTLQAGLARLGPTQTATWLDYNGDGLLDLYIGRETTGRTPYPCELHRNDGDGTFTEVGEQSGVAVAGFVKAVVSGDYDNDGDPDIFVSVARGANLLLRNDGPASGAAGARAAWRFSNVADQAGVALPKDSFPAMFFDYDNDGWLDLYVACYWGAAEDVAADYLGIDTPAERGRLYRNRRDGTFEDATRTAGLYTVMQVMGINFGDLDNDGWLDFYAGTGNPDFHTLVPNRMFRNDGAGRFQDVTTAGNFGHLQKGHAIAWGDVDNDGDQDIFEQMGGAYQADRAYSVLYENPHDRRNVLGLELEGVHANRAALGARVAVTLATPSGARTLHRVVSSGGSFGASTLRMDVGVGDATAITSVSVRWPRAGVAGRTPQVFKGTFEIGNAYRLKEGVAAPERIARRTIALAKGPATPHVH